MEGSLSPFPTLKTLQFKMKTNLQIKESVSEFHLMWLYAEKSRVEVGKQFKGEEQLAVGDILNSILFRIWNFLQVFKKNNFFILHLSTSVICSLIVFHSVLWHGYRLKYMLFLLRIPFFEDTWRWNILSL